MANASQSRLRSRGRILKPRRVVAPGPILDEDVVQAQRRSFREVQSDIQEVIKSTKIPQSALRSGIPRGEVRRVRGIQARAKEAKTEIAKSEIKFEREVAVKAPGKAKSEFRSVALADAIANIEKTIKTQTDKIERYRQREKKSKRKGDDERARDYDDRQDEERAYKKVFVNALRNLRSTDAAKVNIGIQKYFSGFTKKVADFEEDKEEYRNERSEAKRKYLTNQQARIDQQRLKLPKIIGTYTPPSSIQRIKTQLFRDSKKGTILEFLPKKFKKKVQIKAPRSRAGQIYSPALGGFVTNPFSQGTAIVSLPTRKEFEKIQFARGAGSFKGVTTKGFDIAKEGLRKYKETIVEPLSKSKPFKFYERTVVRPVSEKFTQPILGGIGIGIRKYDETVIRRVQKALPGLKDTPLAQVAQVKRDIARLPPDTVLTIGSKANRRQITAGEIQRQGLFEFSKRTIIGEVEGSFTGISKALGAKESVAKGIGKGVGLTTELAPYLVSGAFTTEVGIKASEAALGGKLGGAKDVIQFTRENPIEVALVIGGAGLKGIKTLRGIKVGKGAEAIKYDPSYKKYLVKRGDFKRVELVAETRKVRSRAFKATGFEKKGVQIGDKPGKFTFKKTKVKSRLQLEKSQPTGKWQGDVTEIHRGVAGKPNIYTGSAVYKNGKYTETINLGKNLKKITVIDNAGRGTIRILKKGKEVVRIPISNAKLPPSLKLKTTKIIPEPKVIQSPPQKPVTTRLGKRIKGPGFAEVRPPQVDTTSSLIKAQSKFTIKSGKDIGKGVRKTVERVDDITDIIRVKPRVQIKPFKGEIFKKQFPQRIEFGSAKDIAKQAAKSDQAFFLKAAGRKGVIKDILPKSDRFIRARSAQRLTLTFGDDIIKPSVSKGGRAGAGIAKASKASKSFSEASRKAASKIGKASGSFAEASRKAALSISDKGKSGGQRLSALLKKQAKKTQEAYKVLSTRAALGKPTLAKIPGISIPIVKPQSNILGLLSAGAVIAAVTTKSLQAPRTITKQKTDTETITKTITVSDTDVSQDSAFDTTSVSESASVSVGIPATATTPAEAISGTTARTPLPSRPLIARVPGTLITKDQILLKGKKGKKLRLTKEPEFFLPEAKRNDKWVKLAATGLTRQAAKGRGSRAVDNTIAGRFRIKEVPTGNPNIIDTYFTRTKNKFRDYKIVKGKRVPLKNTWIEKRSGRIDTLGEKRGLTLSKLIKRNDWLGKAKKGKKKPRKLNI